MQFYTDFIAIPGCASAPVVAFFLIRTYPAITSKIAPVAIISRVAEGVTPNRLVVLITNLLVFVNLILIAIKLIRSRVAASPTESIEKAVAGYLTVYAIWTVIAIFILPVAFRFR